VPATRTTKYHRVIETQNDIDKFLDSALLGQLLGFLKFLTAEPVDEGVGVNRHDELISRVKNMIIEEMLSRQMRVDHREHHIMLSYLSDLGFEVVHLNTGDGDVASTRVSIERKEDDLVPSLFDDRRLRQLGAMREEAEFSYLIVTKSYEEVKLGLRDRQVSERLLVSFIASLCAVGYPPIFIADKYDASLLMKKIVDKLEDDKPRIYVPKPKAPTPIEYRNAIIESLPKVGGKTRRKITKVFPSIGALSQASIEDLMKIEGIGKSTAEKIVKVLS
tara:strand:+ start:36150 stop:36977 length:828 start_codon:yes stop_codon:yes gene_type:complete